MVQNANISDRKVARDLITKALQICSNIQLFWADGGYKGKLINWVKITFQRIFEIVLRPKGHFKIVQWRWIVERTFGWLNRYRRLSKDYERLSCNSETWIKISMINLMLHRLKPG